MCDVFYIKCVICSINLFYIRIYMFIKNNNVYKEGKSWLQNYLFYNLYTISKTTHNDEKIVYWLLNVV